MNGCIYRTKDNECDLYSEGGKYHAFCDMDGCEGRKMSNADKIRSMSDAELANFIGFVAQDAFCYGRGMRDRMMIYPFDTHESTMAWLAQAAQPEEGD